jgi:hypothetical protein
MKTREGETPIRMQFNFRCASRGAGTTLEDTIGQKRSRSFARGTCADFSRGVRADFCEAIFSLRLANTSTCKPQDGINFDTTRKVEVIRDVRSGRRA